MNTNLTKYRRVAGLSLQSHDCRKEKDTSMISYIAIIACVLCWFQRISAITSTLQYSLEGSFKESLEQNDTDVLRRCLRTYATIDKMADAENLFRQHTVKPYMEEVRDTDNSTTLGAPCFSERVQD